jgi:hypothetical protein
MMGFLEWVEFNRKKKEKDKKNVGSNSQTGGEVGNQILQGEAPRAHSEVEYQRVSYFPEPQ